MGLTFAAMLAGTAKADLIGASVVVESYTGISSSPDGIAYVTVATPDVELPDALGFYFDSLSINIEADSIVLDVKNYFALGYVNFQGLRFSGLRSPGQVISGFTVESTIGGVPNVFLASAITFGDTTLSVDLQNDPSNGQVYLRGDQIRISLQFSPAAAVPEPSAFAMLGIGGLGFLGYARKRRLVG